MAGKAYFKSMDSLSTVIQVINEAQEALNDKTRVIADSAIPEVLAGAAGAVDPVLLGKQTAFLLAVC